MSAGMERDQWYIPSSFQFICVTPTTSDSLCGRRSCWVCFVVVPAVFWMNACFYNYMNASLWNADFGVVTFVFHVFRWMLCKFIYSVSFCFMFVFVSEELIKPIYF